jgi:hypothetical protein
MGVGWAEPGFQPSPSNATELTKWGHPFYEDAKGRGERKAVPCALRCSEALVAGSYRIAAMQTSGAAGGLPEAAAHGGEQLGPNARTRPGTLRDADAA